MNTPLITIGITCYKAHDTIEKAVQSAIRQTWANTEIIIVDDCSCDETVKRLENLKKKFPFLHIIYQDVNRGVAASRNKIIKLAIGEFIAFIDDDDISNSKRLEKQYDRITSYEKQFVNSYPIICHTARKQIYPDNSSRYEPTIGIDEGIVPNSQAVVQRILTGKPITNNFGSLATCSQMARTSIYRKLKGFDENFKRVEDTDFNIRAAITGAHFVGIAEPLVIQTMTLASDKKLADEKRNWLLLMEKHKIFLGRKSIYNFCCRWLVAKYDFLQGAKTKFIFKIIGLLITNPVLTLQRMYWALPNTSFNLTLKQFHDKKT